MRALKILAGLISLMPACAVAHSTSDDTQGEAATKSAGNANPLYMLGQFGAYTRAGIDTDTQGELDTLGGPLAVRIAHVADGKAFVMLFHTPSRTAIEGWATLDGRTARLTATGARDCAFTMERVLSPHRGESENLRVTAVGAGCPQPWKGIDGLAQGVNLPRALEWWIDLREGLYQPSFKLYADPHREDSRIILSVKRDKDNRLFPNPESTLQEVTVSKVTGYAARAIEVDLHDVSGTSPNRYGIALPGAACPGVDAPKPQIHLFADGTFELVGCGKTETYFQEDPNGCGSLTIGRSCSSQEVIDASEAQSSGP